MEDNFNLLRQIVVAAERFAVSSYLGTPGTSRVLTVRERFT
jgi:hypothetical protein